MKEAKNIACSFDKSLMDSSSESQNTPPKSQSKTGLKPQVAGESLISSNIIVNNLLKPNGPDSLAHDLERVRAMIRSISPDNSKGVHIK